MNQQRLWLQALIGGTTAGVLLEVLVLRLNPEIPVELGPLLLGHLLWMSWGGLAIGTPLLAIWGLARIFRPVGKEVPTWRVPEVIALIYGIGAVLTRVNANIHQVFLSGTGHRTLGQDAVGWLIGGLLAMAAGMALRKKSKRIIWRWLFVIFFLILPLVRLLGRPSPQSIHLQVEPQPLGCPARPLVVIGIEGLDTRFLQSHVRGDRFPNLARFVGEGSWGPLVPYQPYLRQSIWTSAVTGTFPRRHGVKARWAWHLPVGFAGPLRLLPWTPFKSGWVLPWWIANKNDSPPSCIPPLWERLRASDVATQTFGWPGVWAVPTGSAELTAEDGISFLEPDLRRSLEAALERFPDEHEMILDAVGRDVANCIAASQSLAAGTRNLWLYFGSLVAVRRNLEPTRVRHVGEREVMELLVELLDQQVGNLHDAAGADALIALVSPYGMNPPSSKERLLRLIGAGGTWRTSAHTCPDGLLALHGDGVQQGQQFAQARLPDLAPTLCFLLGLPVAQYMDGRVILDSVEPEYLSSHPLRFVE
jgi:hypothetical protein